MAGKTRSVRQDQIRRAREQRTNGTTWTEIAIEFAERYDVNIRVAYRLAHGWSQGNAAEQWNNRWPAEPKTFKSFSYWELWPASTGHAPSLEVLARLAELYECRVADLLIDCADFRHNDAAHQARVVLAALPAVVADPEPEELSDRRAGQGSQPSSVKAPADLALPTRSSDAWRRLASKLDTLDIDTLRRTAALWSTNTDPGGRRGLLPKLSAALSLAVADGTFRNSGLLAQRASHRQAEARSLTGLWRSRYSYYSTTRAKQFDGEHYIVLHMDGEDLEGESLAHSTGSRLALSLSVNTAIATGTWTEHTSPSGHYGGAVYHGTLQLVISPSGRAMKGKWIGFGKDFDINSGDWELRWEASYSESARLDYDRKL